MRKVLLLGESWMTHMIHQKGFDSFTTTEYVEGGQEFSAALHAGGWEVTHLPAHTIEDRMPTDVDGLRRYDLVVISDVGSNTFLLSKQVFNDSKQTVNRLAVLRDYVLDGGGLLMVGGYLSFAGIDAKARYGSTPLGDLLPVRVLEVDDRVERPDGVAATVLAPDHPALGGVDGAWPALLGYNRTHTRPEGTVLVEVDGDPLVAVRTCGGGRTAVFTSDMAPHWAPPEFLAWGGYTTLWQALATWTAAAVAGVD